ncbi:hypothetical protein QTP88_025530 [Uroleucon formosanum]
MFIENTKSSIQEIPFPSVTICPSSQIRKSVWEKYMDTNSSYWDDLQLYRDVMTCSTNTYFHNLEQNLREYIDYDMIKNHLHDCGINCPEIFQSDGQWQNKTLKNVCQYIQPTILGIFGLCYTINMMPINQMFNNEYYQRYMDFFSTKITYVNTKRSYWNLENGYSFYENQPNLMDVIPFRTSGVSYNHRVKLMLNALENNFLSCANLGVSGGSFLITFSNPAEYCSVSPRIYIIPDTYTKIQITPFVKKINSDLMWRSLEIRKCYLHNERRLSIFQQYTELNCNHECEINKTITMCGCIMIEGAFLGINGSKICGPAKYSCALEAKHSTKHPTNLKECNCLPTCSMIEYEITDTSNVDDWKYIKSINLVQNNMSLMKITRLNVHTLPLVAHQASPPPTPPLNARRLPLANVHVTLDRSATSSPKINNYKNI